MSSVDVVNVSRSYGGVEAIPGASVSIAGQRLVDARRAKGPAGEVER
jgi:hypothetical protein